jgi:hypothetical protein
MVAKMDVKLNLKGKTDIKNMTKEEAAEFGMDIIMAIISGIHLAETEFYMLVGDMCGMTPDEAAEADIEQLIDALKAVWQKLVSFFRSPAD